VRRLVAAALGARRVRAGHRGRRPLPRVPRRRAPPLAAARGGGLMRARPAPYAELSCQSAFSFLRGASEPETLVQRAAELGYAALALTDRDGLYGAPRFHRAAEDAGLRAVHGTTLTLARAGLTLARAGLTLARAGLTLARATSDSAGAAGAARAC